MLHVPIELVRQAVDELAHEGELTAESFIFGDKTWRVAPSDVKRITHRIEQKQATGETPVDVPKRRVKRKRIEPVQNEENGDS